MKWWIPVLCATLALSTEPQGESASLGSSKREEDRLIVRDAKYIARRELAATQRAVEGELRRVKMYRFEDQGLVKASEARQDRVPALAARYSERDIDLRKQAVDTATARAAQKRRKEKELQAVKQRMKLQERKESSEKVTEAIQQADASRGSSWNGLQRTMVSVLGNEVQADDALAKKLRARDENTLANAEQVSSTVLMSTLPIRKGAQEKVTKARTRATKKAQEKQAADKAMEELNAKHQAAVAAKKTHVSGKEITKRALSAMKSELESERDTVHHEISREGQLGGQEALRIAKNVLTPQENIRNHILEQAENNHNNLMQNVKLVQHELEPQKRILKDTMDRMVADADQAHKLRLKRRLDRKRAEKVAALKAEKQNRLKKKMLMPEALAQMKRIQMANRKANQAVLANAAKQIDGDEAHRVFAALRAHSADSSSSAELRKFQQANKNVMKAALSEERQVLQDDHGTKVAAEKLVAKMAVKDKELKQKRAKRIAYQMSQHELRKAKHRELASKAIQEVKAGHGYRSKQSLKIVTSGLHNEELQESRTVKESGRLTRSVANYATKLAKSYLRNSSKLRRKEVAHVIKQNAGVDTAAIEAKLSYDRQHVQAQAKINRLIVDQARAEHQKKVQEAVKLKAKQQKDIKLATVDAQQALVEHTKDADKLVERGMKEFSVDPLTTADAYAKAEEEQKTKEMTHQSDSYVVHKALVTASKVEDSMLPVKQRAREMVQKAPKLHASYLKKRAMEKSAKSSERVQKANSAIDQAQRRNKQRLALSASSEKAYKVGDKRVQAVINAEVSQFPDALSEAKKAQQQYVIAKQRGSQDLTTKVDGATTSVKLADEELQKFQAASLPSSWTGGINNAKEAEAEEEFVPDVKYEKSRDGRYNSFMETLSKPAFDPSNYHIDDNLLKL